MLITIVNGGVIVPEIEQASRRISEDNGNVQLPSIPMASEESVHLLTSVKFPPPALFFANPNKKWTLSDFEKLGKPISYSVNDKEMEAENIKLYLPTTTIMADVETKKKNLKEKTEDEHGEKQDNKTEDEQQFPFISLLPQTSENPTEKPGDEQGDKMTENPVNKTSTGQEEHKDKTPVEKVVDGQTEIAVEKQIEKTEVVQGENTEGKPVREAIDGQDEKSTQKQVEKPETGQNVITAEKPAEKTGDKNGKTESPPKVEGRTGIPPRRRPVQPVNRPMSQPADSWTPKKTLPNYPPMGILRPPHTIVQLTSKSLPSPNVDIRLFDRVAAAIEARSDKEPETAEGRHDSQVGNPAVAYDRPSKYLPAPTEIGRPPVGQMILLTSRPLPPPAVTHVQFRDVEYNLAGRPDTLSANVTDSRT